MDGVFHEEEVLFALKELVQGRILKIENEYFIDVDTPAFGIRRINLSTITLCVLNSVFVSEAPESETVIRLLIENSISQLFIAVGLSAKNPLIALGEMAECFYSIRLPGTLREWMCGRRHARTLRPEALLRRHLQMRERLTDLGNFKQHARRIRSNQYLIDALNQACDKQNNFDSNVLRMKKLASVLEGLSGTFLSLADNVMVQYAWFLSTKCPKIKSPSSVRTHFYVIKPLVQNICLDIEELDELATIDWLEVSTTFLSDATDERKVASLNYLLRLFKQPEIKSLKKDEARSSRTYVDYPSTAEIELAINLIIKDINLSEYQMLAALMLKLMSHLPLRAEDVASLRICDVFIGELPFIVITSASTGSRKSENANRVLFLTDLDLIHQLKVLQQLRVSMSKVEQPTTSLFGSSEKLTSFEGTEELLSIISNALRCASGSSFVRPHSLRSKYLSEKFSEALMPKNTPSDALQQRNILYALATIAGHADPDVTVKNYVCDFNHIRRSWVDRLVLDGLKLSPNFIASVSTISYEAARKRLQRSSLIGDLIKNFQLGVTDQLKTRIFDMMQSHQLVDFEYALSTEKESVVLEIQAAQFLSCLLLGMERAAAAAYLNTPNLLPYEIESNLNIFIAYKGTKFFTKLRIDYERFKLGEGFVSLSQHFGLNINDSVHAAQLLRLIPLQMEKPWTVNIKDISFILEFIAPRLQCADFNLTVLIPDINSQENQERISQLYRLGVRRVEEKSRRNFSARDQLMILFRKTGISHQSNLDQKISNFEINIFMLSVLIKHKIQG